MIKKHLISATALLLVSGSATAAVYKSVDAEGNTVYTDEPAAGAKPVDLPPLSTIPPPTYSPAVSKKPEAAGEDSAVYQSINIIEPAPDATLRDNTGAVPVKVGIDPPLKATAGHRFQFYLDGQTQGKPTRSSKIVIANVNRGTHNVEVAVLDAEGREITRSSPVQFHLHRQSINFPRGPGGPATLPVPRAN
ncbi:MAG TPA: DUF4124 domain-containing protein [Gammaproteobacteria bacterium]|nr:DUF4124 domain-containing protein [Gammaproteobacteria bacterium]